MNLYERRMVIGGVLFGIGLMASIDEILFHQILQWHHFYDLGTSIIALQADGFLHAFELMALVGGAFLMVDAKKKTTVSYVFIASTIFIGAGSFQLFDGLVIHKLFRLHQIRYVDDLWMYDMIWNASACILLFVGIGLFRKVKRD